MLVISQSGILVFLKYVFCILQILGIRIIKLRVLIDASVMWWWFLTPRYVAIYRVCVCVASNPFGVGDCVLDIQRARHIQESWVNSAELPD